MNDQTKGDGDTSRTVEVPHRWEDWWDRPRERGSCTLCGGPISTPLDLSAVRDSSGTPDPWVSRDKYGRCNACAHPVEVREALEQSNGRIMIGRPVCRVCGRSGPCSHPGEDKQQGFLPGSFTRCKVCGKRGTPPACPGKCARLIGLEVCHEEMITAKHKAQSLNPMVAAEGLIELRDKMANLKHRIRMFQTTIAAAHAHGVPEYLPKGP